MNKLAIFASLALFSFAFSASGSEVAEAAKKERERRQAVEKQRRPAKVFTNQDVSNLKSSLAFEASQPEAVEPAESQSGITTIPGPPPEPVPAQQPEVSAEEEERAAENERLKEERERLEQQARDAQQTINQGGGYHTRNIGSQYKAKREAETRIREIDQKLKESETEEGEEEE
jgi:hypothetical protein